MIHVLDGRRLVRYWLREGLFHSILSASCSNIFLLRFFIFILLDSKFGFRKLLVGVSIRFLCVILAIIAELVVLCPYCWGPY